MAVTRFRKAVLQGVNPFFIHLVEIHQAVADLIGRIAELQNDFIRAPGNAAQINRKTVPAQDWENDADFTLGKFTPDVSRNVIAGRVIVFRPGNDRLGYGNDIPVTQIESFVIGGEQHAFNNDFRQIVSAFNNGSSYTSRSCPCTSRHLLREKNPLLLSASPSGRPASCLKSRPGSRPRRINRKAEEKDAPTLLACGFRAGALQLAEACENRTHPGGS